MINFGVIGMGNRGQRMLELVTKSRSARPVAICDADLGRKAQYESYKEQGLSFYSDYRQLLADAAVEAVIITTPDGTHGEILCAALKAGKKIICEKPLEISEDKIYGIFRQYKTCPGVITLGYVLRYAPLFQKAKELITGGAVGRVISVNAIDNIHYGGYAFFHDWHRLRKNTTSLLLQKASHSLDIINWLVDSRPASVAAFGGLDVFGKDGAVRVFGKETDPALHCAECAIESTCPESLYNMERIKGVKWQDNWPDSCVYNSEIDVDDNQSLIIRYENNAKLSYTLNQFTPQYKREYVFIGDKGKLSFDDVSNVITVTSRASQNVDTYTVVNPDIHGGGDEGLLNDFIECCQTLKTPVANLQSGAVSALLALAAQKSIDEERIVKIEYQF